MAAVSVPSAPHFHDERPELIRPCVTVWIYRVVSRRHPDPLAVHEYSAQRWKDSWRDTGNKIEEIIIYDDSHVEIVRDSNGQEGVLDFRNSSKITISLYFDS
jgi:hypothetical protein